MLPAVLGGIGFAGGALGGGALAGRYMPVVAQQALKAGTKGKQKLSAALRGAAGGMEKYGAGGPGAIGAMATDVQSLLAKGAGAVENIPAASLARAGAGVGTLAGGGVGAVLGSQALGGIGNALMPQEPAVDPESYGSSNSMGARYKASTMQYV